MNWRDNNRSAVSHTTRGIMLKVLLTASLSLLCLGGIRAYDALSHDGVEGQLRPLINDVRHFMKQFPEAWNTPDIDQLVSLFAPEAVLLTPSGHATTRPNIRDLLVREQMELFNGKRLALDLKSIIVHGASDVTVEGTYTLDGYTASGFSSMPPGSIHFALSGVGNSWSIEKAEMER